MGGGDVHRAKAWGRADPPPSAVCHHADIGGSVPGGQGFANTEIHQEGLRIPPSKLYEGEKPNETIYRLLEKAVRAPETVLGDLLAQVTATRIGERELLALVERSVFFATSSKKRSPRPMPARPTG